MMRNVYIISLFMLFFFVCWAEEASAENCVMNYDGWRWHDEKGKQHNIAELDSILNEHSKWLVDVSNVAQNYKINREAIFEILMQKGKLDSLQNYDLKTEILNLLSDKRRCNLVNSDLSGCSLKTRTDLALSILDGSKFNNSYLPELSVSYATAVRSEFRNTKFLRAYINNANFMYANFEDAEFIEMWNTTSANFKNADLRGSNVSCLELSVTVLEGANLSKMDLSNVNGREIRFINTKLCGAIFIGSNLEKVDFTGADMKETIFEPVSDFGNGLPRSQNIARARNLGFLTYKQSAAKLAELKKQLFEEGFRTASKQVNAALRRKDANLAEYIFFDLPCEYGSNYWRPIKLLVITWIICGLIYLSAAYGNIKKYKYLICSNKSFNNGYSLYGSLMYKQVHDKWTKLKIASLFSLQRSFRIGFRDFSPNHWLKMLLHPDYDFETIGWPRYLSAVQSLVSVYFIVMMLVSYFGRLFD